MQQDPRNFASGQSGFGQTQWTVVGAPQQNSAPNAPQPPYPPQEPYQQQVNYGQVPPPYTPPAPPPAYAPPAPPQGPRAVPPTGMPRARKPRKPVWVIFLVVFLVVLVCAGIAVATVLGRGGQAYGYVQLSTLNASYKGDAVIVRNETLYTQEGASLIEQNVEEGAEVERSETVCVVYTAGFNTRELTTLENYRSQIKDYHKTLLASSTTKDMRLDRLEGDVLTQAVAAQSLVQGVTRGSLVEQEKTLKTAMQARQVYLKQKYPDDQKLSRLYDDENTQEQKISSWTKQYAAASNGIVSFYTDGYENVLNLYNYADYSPVQIRAMFNGQTPEDETRTKNTVPVYRLVRQGQFVVLMLCSDPDWTPVEGRSYKLRIENFDTTIVNATVESFTRSGGELLVRLVVSGDINLGNIMYTRTCSVQLGESVDTLTVPARAIHSQNGKTGVVMATESGSYWTPVSVITTEGDYAHIIPENAGVLYEGIPVLLF
ncbi:MAG: hypothetical protein E7326_00375 [Clostridiales bacterium]|nr:hypothetical protein [Clostridiales bacterium]